MKPLARILLTVILLQILQVGGIKSMQVLGVVDVLAEGREAIYLIQHASAFLSVNDITRVAVISIAVFPSSLWYGVTALVLVL